jgi:hypothetical protein
VDLGPGDGTLTVHADGTYEGNISKTFKWTATEVCTFPTATVTQSVVLDDQIGFNMNGTIAGGVMKGNIIDPGFPNVTFSGSWDFAAKF